MLWHWILTLVLFLLGLNALRHFSSSIPSSGTTTRCYGRIETGSATYPPPSGEDNIPPGASAYSRPMCISASEGRIVNLFQGELEKQPARHGYAFPGFWDGHGHLLGYGEMLRSVSLYGAESIDGTHTTPKKWRIIEADTPQRSRRG